jgi:hypothetical protein
MAPSIGWHEIPSRSLSAEVAYGGIQDGVACPCRIEAGRRRYTVAEGCGHDGQLQMQMQMQMQM